jgi:hypothetical protein
MNKKKMKEDIYLNIILSCYNVEDVYFVLDEEEKVKKGR